MLLLHTVIQNSNLGINSALDFAEILFLWTFVFVRCLILTCQLKTRFLFNTSLAKELFSWQINMAVLQINILLK